MDHFIYRDDIVNRRFFLFTVVWPVSSYGMGRDVHRLKLSIQHFLCRPLWHPTSKVPWTGGFEEALDFSVERNVLSVRQRKKYKCINK